MESGEKSSFWSSRVCFNAHQIFQNFESLYNIVHILTQLIQTSRLVTHFCVQAVFKSINQKLYLNTVKSTVIYNIYNITIIEQSTDELQDAHNTVT